MSLQAIIHIKNMYSHVFSDIPGKRLKRNIKKRYARYGFDISELFGDTSGEPRI